MNKDLEIRVEKTNEIGVVFGYGFVCAEDGVDYTDLHGDHIGEQVMLKAAVDFMQGDRVAKEMHQGDSIGEVVFAYPITDEICSSLGMTAEKSGLVIGMKPNAEVLGKFKDGTYKAFSLGGLLSRIEKLMEEKRMAKKGKGKGRKKPMKKEVSDMTLLEFSAVDFPAQEGAVAAIIKSMGTETLKVRIVDEKPTEKAGSIAQMVTSEEDGHVHGVSLYCSCDEIRVYLDYANTESGVNHSHALQKSEEGLVVHKDAGHSHTIDADGFMSAVSEVLEVKHADLDDETDQGVSEETSMTEEELKALQEVQMSPAHKAHYDSLDGVAKDTFRAKSFEDRDAVVSKAEAEKEADPVAVALKAARDEIAELKQARKDDAVAKRASELRNIGDADLTSAIVKAVDTIEDAETKSKVDAFLDNVNKSSSVLFKAIGNDNDTTLDVSDKAEANAKLDELAKKRASEKSISFAAAHVEIQDENPELTNKARERAA